MSARPDNFTRTVRYLESVRKHICPPAVQFASESTASGNLYSGFSGILRYILSFANHKKPESRNLLFFRWILIAGVEAANAESVPTLQKLLKMAEDMRAAAEADLKARIENNDPILGQPNTDPAAFVRETILKGLCIHPNPEVRALVEPYLKDTRRGYVVGLALLRDGHPEGLQCILDYWEGYPSGSRAAEVFLVYTAADILPHSTYHPTIAKAKAWYAKNKDAESLRQRVALVNQSGLSDAIVEPLKLWP